ncbi:hypothetical protein Sinac_7678 (plasmid) [Singulisphaera acidiphila DSM 18658]|uniref:Uncharacterized protein n=1 Tax=Singulisphaera acidiphila (strain ATCC BAA-1392 / DSM 18658 / VKM B-2454 / MOB10) TaxID=886293 RepID=L0DRU8_SINAD|nr:hypothetical protein Sinac_7678 [Singulisphaera acidiphila DSM 18658]
MTGKDVAKRPQEMSAKPREATGASAAMFDDEIVE